MKNLWLLLVAFAALWTLSSPATCQDGAGSEAYSVSLKPESGLVVAGQPIVLVLTIDVVRDTKLAATVVSGRHLEVTVGEGKPKTVKNSVAGSVMLAGGTKIERRIVVDPADIGAGVSAEPLTIGMSWPGLPGASATVTVTPDLTGVKIEDLDLAETRVVLVTNYGSMTVRFYPDKAPNHVKNFITLSKDGFYNGTKFHRVMRGFMLQGGCPNTKEGATGQPGTGNSGRMLKAEFNDVKHTRGILSMARSPAGPDTASCQFFVMHGANPGLNGQYSAFGYLEKGSDTLDTIAGVPVGPSPTREMSSPLKPVELQFAVVLPAYKK